MKKYLSPSEVEGVARRLFTLMESMHPEEGLALMRSCSILLDGMAKRLDAENERIGTPDRPTEYRSLGEVFAPQEPSVGDKLRAAVGYGPVMVDGTVYTTGTEYINPKCYGWMRPTHSSTWGGHGDRLPPWLMHRNP
jgi:hypothetical protein